MKYSLIGLGIILALVGQSRAETFSSRVESPLDLSFVPPGGFVGSVASSKALFCNRVDSLVDMVLQVPIFGPESIDVTVAGYRALSDGRFYLGNVTSALSANSYPGDMAASDANCSSIYLSNYSSRTAHRGSRIGGGDAAFQFNPQGGESWVRFVDEFDGPHDMLSADLDRNGSPDAVAISQKRITVFYDFVAGGSSSARQEIIGIEGLASAFKAQLADANRDGRLDIIVLAYNPYAGSEIQSFLNLGSSFGQPIISALNSGDYSIDMFVSDLNGDRMIDVLLPHAVALGQGNGSFDSQPISTDAWASLTGPSVMADFNVDGRLDLAGLRYNNDSTVDLLIFRGTGTGQLFESVPAFQTTVQSDWSRYIATLSAVDINADTKPDLISLDYVYGGGTGDTSMAISSFLNQTIIKLPPPPPAPGGSSPGGKKRMK